MPKIKDLTLQFDQRPMDVLTGKIVAVNLIAQSEDLEGLTFILSHTPKREITFLFPPLANNEDYTATIFLAPKKVIAPLIEIKDPPITEEALELSEDNLPKKEDLLAEIDAIKKARSAKKASRGKSK